MSFLNAVINRVGDEQLRENFQERVDIIQHKIKFMDKVAVACLDTKNNLSEDLKDLIAEAGGVLQDDVNTARVVVYYEKSTSMLQLMGVVPSLLDKEWPSVEYDRVYLWDDEAAVADEADVAVNALEDLAEMLYPGYFVFGNEGKTWMSFKTQ
jgi:iron complex transport system substrate-binding protein